MNKFGGTVGERWGKGRNLLSWEEFLAIFPQLYPLEIVETTSASCYFPYSLMQEH